MELSVVIPTYQSEKYILRAIRSLLNQNWNKDNFEIIVVDDGSSDNTFKVIEGVFDKIKYIKNSRNLGLSAARNTGIRNAKGRFITFLDSDDYVHADILRIGHMFLSLNSSLDAVEFDYYLVNDREEHIEYISSSDKPIACGIFYRIEQLIDIGLFDESFMAREEEDLRLRFTKKYKIYSVQLPLYRYRRHDNNLTNHVEKMDDFKKKLLNKHEVKK
jgi:glycosyltransferase involved in cell wall biosynthesis